MLETVAPPSQATTVRDADVKADTQIHVQPLSEGDDSDHETPSLQDVDLTATHIVSSPYTDLSNQLNLTPLEPQPRLLAHALTTLAPIRADYATAPYMSAFNWPHVFSTLRALCAQTGLQWQRQEFYVVIFRSKLLPDANRVRLGELDQRSHEEACASGGLLRYWFGSTDGERRNLATCVWVNREDAAAGGRGPWHKKARGAAREMYETISFHTHTLVVEDGAKAWELKEYEA